MNQVTASCVGAQLSATQKVALTSGQAIDLCSLALDAGTYEVDGTVVFERAASTSVTQESAWANTASASMPDLPGDGCMAQIACAAAVPGASSDVMPLGRGRFQIAGPATIYLTVQANFTISTMSAYGRITAKKL